LNGIAMFSRIAPIDRIKIINFGEGTIPSVQINFRINDRPVAVIGTHPYSPVNRHRFYSRGRQYVKLAEYIRALDMPVLIVGDFNSTVWQKDFRQFTADSRLSNSIDKFGMQPTWPTILPRFLRLQIDHVFYSKGINLINKTVGPNIGSDHLPVISDFLID
jgi:endonuclease/exonuclease/phosphatase (EEP) superfamily protein YafD